MKYQFLGVLFFILLIGCRNGTKEEDSHRGSGNSLFELSFKEYEEIELLRNFEKVSDTSIETGIGENDFRLLELKNYSDNIIMFYKKVERDSLVVDDFVFKVVDTIHIRNLEGNEKITIGYCYKEGFRDGEIIAIVEETDSLYVTTIEKAWRANPQSGRIEDLTDLSGISCLNEEFESDPASVSLGK